MTFHEWIKKNTGRFSIGGYRGWLKNAWLGGAVHAAEILLSDWWDQGKDIDQPDYIKKQFIENGIQIIRKKMGDEMTSAERICPNCKEPTLNGTRECACFRNKCVECGGPVGNITFTICDDCWEKKYRKRRTPPKDKPPGSPLLEYDDNKNAGDIAKETGCVVGEIGCPNCGGVAHGAIMPVCGWCGSSYFTVHEVDQAIKDFNEDAAEWSKQEAHDGKDVED